MSCQCQQSRISIFDFITFESITTFTDRQQKQIHEEKKTKEKENQRIRTLYARFVLIAKPNNLFAFTRKYLSHSDRSDRRITSLSLLSIVKNGEGEICSIRMFLRLHSPLTITVASPFGEALGLLRPNLSAPPLLSSNI